MKNENSPVIFTQEEQVELRNLNSNLELFNLLKSLLTQGQFPGSAAVALIRCQQFAENIIQQTSKQLQEVEQKASSRSEKPASDKKSKETKNG
jgi:hypothetical protein